MRVEMHERVFLVEIEMLGQPVKGAGVIILYIDRQGDRRAGRAPGRGHKQQQSRQLPFHRAPRISGFWESGTRNSTRAMQVSW